MIKRPTDTYLTKGQAEWRSGLNYLVDARLNRNMDYPSQSLLEIPYGPSCPCVGCPDCGRLVRRRSVGLSFLYPPRAWMSCTSIVPIGAFVAGRMKANFNKNCFSDTFLVPQNLMTFQNDVVKVQNSARYITLLCNYYNPIMTLLSIFLHGFCMINFLHYWESIFNSSA